MVCLSGPRWGRHALAKGRVDPCPARQAVRGRPRRSLSQARAAEPISGGRLNKKQETSRDRRISRAEETRLLDAALAIKTIGRTVASRSMGRSLPSCIDGPSVVRARSCSALRAESASTTFRRPGTRSTSSPAVSSPVEGQKASFGTANNYGDHCKHVS